MRPFSATVLVTLALALAGCASNRAATLRLGEYERLQPQLSHGRSGTLLHLAHPAHVQILQLSSEGVVQLYPRSPEHATYFEAGSHPIDVLTWRRSASTGACAPHEGSTSAWPDERDRRPSTRETRPSTRRGRSTLCTGSSRTRTPVRDVLILATEKPLESEQIENLIASAPAARDMQALAAQLEVAAGTHVWAASLTQVLVR